ncbi:TlpA family protein disulfide reductase [Aquimarina algiphila]|uniref:TlpA family protein disulfide reductase n=1 Tax=Aquimarina algiphila TaxID=2047982 RepID=UPI002331462B|nr:TlpA disulfide reductase family protein [Aquimarina algiphila]
MKKTLRFLVFITVIVTISFYGFVKYNGVNNGKQAPDFETTLIDGTLFKLSDLKGKYVLLDFWDSWCPPCRKENPKLAALYKKYSDKLTVVTVALEKNNKHWKKASEKDGFVWKNQIVNQNRFVLMSSIARKYGVTEIPAKFLISPEGNIVGKLSFNEIEKILLED